MTSQGGLPAPNNPQQNQSASAGLGHSPPLVALPSSNVIGSGIRIATSDNSISPHQPHPQPTSTMTTTATKEPTMVHPLTITPPAINNVGNNNIVTPAPPPPPPPPPPTYAQPIARQAAPPQHQQHQPVAAHAPIPAPHINESKEVRPVLSTTPTRATAPVVVAASSSVPSNKVKVSPGSKSLDMLADEFLSGPRVDEKAPILRPLPLPQDDTQIDRLHTLVERRAWGDVLQITGDLLRGDASSPHQSIYSTLMYAGNKSDISQQEQGLQKETIEIMTLECLARLKLRRYTDLASEIDRWNFITQNDSTAVSPKWIPWSLHVLAAETLQYTDRDSQRCIDVLNKLRDDIESQDNDNNSNSFWLCGVHHALANVFVRQGEWRLALKSYDDLFDILPAATEYYIKTNWTTNKQHADLICKVLLGLYKCELSSRQGRIFLQVGALHEASVLFDEAKKELSTTSDIYGGSDHYSATLPDDIRKRLDEYVSYRNAPVLLLVNNGLKSFAYGDFDNSMSFFNKAIKEQRETINNNANSKFRLEDWVGPSVVGVDSNSLMLTNSCNNMALGALYTCQMHEAVHLLESLIREDPTEYLTEGLAFNLCTLYELGADPAVSTRNKRVLQLIAKRFFLHDIGPESFRVS